MMVIPLDFSAQATAWLIVLGDLLKVFAFVGCGLGIARTVQILFRLHRINRTKRQSQP